MLNKERGNKIIMLEIKQLTPIEQINCEKQKRIHGGDNDEALWTGYSMGMYNISPSNKEIVFTPSNPSAKNSYVLDPSSGHVGVVPEPDPNNITSDDPSGDS
jgi:hypothetical protein